MEPLDAAVADRVAAAVTGCPGVSRLADDGLAGHLATYLPGRRVSGLRAGPTGLEVALVARWGVALPALAGEVRDAVRPVVGPVPVDVHVVDVDDPAVILALPPPAPAEVPAGGA